MPSLIAIAHIQSDFPTKFGIPRQSGLVDDIRASIVFEREYRIPEALRGLETFSHIWILWGFLGAGQAVWSPTVRPPRLGGNTRMGVFATRSPYRPNAIGLSSVKVDRIEKHASLGPVIHVLGADLMDGTPIYDIKPYLPYTDSHPDASGGFACGPTDALLHVRIGSKWPELLPERDIHIIKELLAHDPRPSYQHDKGRVYGMEYRGLEVKFTVDKDTLTVLEIVKRTEENIP